MKRDRKNKTRVADALDLVNLLAKATNGTLEVPRGGPPGHRRGVAGDQRLQRHCRARLARRRQGQTLRPRLRRSRR